MSMDRFALRLTLALAICICSAGPPYSQTRHVVILYDGRTELPGLSLLDASLARTLTAGSKYPVEVYRETMDLSRFGSDA